MKSFKHFLSTKYLLPFLRPYSQCLFCSKNFYSKSGLSYLSKLQRFKISKSNFSILSCLMKKNNNSEDIKEFVFDDPYTTFTNRLYRHPGIFHNVLVVQPRNKSKTNWESTEYCEPKLSEAVALIDTLHQWKVVDKVSILSLELHFFFFYN